jgi:integrase
LERGETAVRSVLWSQATKEFLQKKAIVNRPATAATYGFSLDAFARIVKPDNLKKIDVGVLGRFAAARKNEGVTAETVNRDLRAVRALMRYAEEQHFVAKVPKFKTVWIRQDEKPPVVIPQAEYEAMLATLDSGTVKLTKRSSAWWKTFTQLVHGLGLRRGEMLGLRWESVDLEKAELTVLSETSKGRRCRTLPLVQELATALGHWRESNPDEERVLPYDGNVRHLYEDWHKFAGKNRTPKQFRSTTGSALIEAGTPTVVVKDFLGHSSVVITEKHYVNTSGSLRKAAEARKARETG